MMTSKVKEAATRATRDDVVEWQEKLRQRLDVLVHENRVMHLEERSAYYTELGKALVGVENDMPVPLPEIDLDGVFTQSESLEIRNAGDYLRRLAYVEGLRTNRNQMSFYWKAARGCALNAFAMALKSATWHSAELISKGKLQVTSDW